MKYGGSRFSLDRHGGGECSQYQVSRVCRAKRPCLPRARVSRRHPTSGNRAGRPTQKRFLATRSNLHHEDHDAHEDEKWRVEILARTGMGVENVLSTKSAECVGQAALTCHGPEFHGDIRHLATEPVALHKRGFSPEGSNLHHEDHDAHEDEKWRVEILARTVATGSSRNITIRFLFHAHKASYFSYLWHHLKLPVRMFGDAGLEFTEDIE